MYIKDYEIGTCITVPEDAKFIYNPLTHGWEEPNEENSQIFLGFMCPIEQISRIVDSFVVTRLRGLDIIFHCWEGKEGIIIAK